MGISLKRSCITGESEIAYLYCISLKHIYMEDSRLLGVVLVCLYRISLLHIFIAYLYCIASLHLFIAYLYCISLLHIFKAYLYCISLCRVAVFCCLGVGSIFGRFGGVFVRFLVVLGGLRGVLEALLEVLGALGRS